jgi:hypothetical protein
VNVAELRRIIDVEFQRPGTIERGTRFDSESFEPVVESLARRSRQANRKPGDLSLSPQIERQPVRRRGAIRGPFAARADDASNALSPLLLAS